MRANEVNEFENILESCTEISFVWHISLSNQNLELSDYTRSFVSLFKFYAVCFLDVFTYLDFCWMYFKKLQNVRIYTLTQCWNMVTVELCGWCYDILLIIHTCTHNLKLNDRSIFKNVHCPPFILKWTCTI